MPAPCRAASSATDTAFRVEAYEKIDYSLELRRRGLRPLAAAELADTFAPCGRCLMVVDENVLALHGDRDPRPTSPTTGST